MRRNLLGCSLLLLMGVGGWLAPAASAKILFVETFSTGTLPNSGVWNVNQTGTDFVIETDVSGQGPGDGLLRILGAGDGGSPAWGDTIYSIQSFPRGNNLRVSYRQWVPFGSNAQIGIHGPWHNTNSGPQYGNIEAGIDYVYGNLNWGEAIPPNSIQGGNHLATFGSRFTAGNTKNGSLLQVFTFGNTTGVRFDWYQTDPNLGTRLSAAPEKDTRGLANDPDNALRVTSSASNVYLGWGNFDSATGSTYLDDIVVENDEVANPGEPTLLFVGASRDWAAGATHGYQSPGGDFRLRQYLEQIGYNVEFVDDNDAVTADATGKAAVIISATVGSGNVGDKFTDVDVPVITWEAGLFDDLNIAQAAGGTVNNQTQIEIQDAVSFIVGGLSGTVTTSANDDGYNYASPSPSATGAQVLASIVGQPTQATIVVYEAGSQMDNGFVAPAKRVGLFLGNFRASETLTAEGKLLFRNVVDWATERLVPVELSEITLD